MQGENGIIGLGRRMAKGCFACEPVKRGGFGQAGSDPDASFTADQEDVDHASSIRSVAGGGVGERADKRA